MRFNQRVAIVTGAARGIGAVTAEAFAREGARVAVVDLDAAGAERFAKQLTDSGAEALASGADVSAAAPVQALVDAVLARWGRIDVLVNNAGGFSSMKPTEEISDAEWESVLRSNLTTAFVCTRAVLPAMKRQRAGRIVNVSSVAARAGTVRTMAHYAAAKAGIIGFTRHLAVEVGGDGITVNAIAPGTAATERVLNLRTPDETRQIGASIPLGRLAEPAEIADGILFLASDAAKFVTGIVLDVNGGQVLA